MRSDNFAFFKAISIAFVILGHYYKDVSIIWVPVAFGLMIFSYSSAYFTSLKYKEGFSLREYWIQKANRLGINLLIINLFMGLYCLLSGCIELWSWQTPINFFAMTGFLEWLDLPVSNAFTGGRWFLTVLILFYILYPLLLKIFKGERETFITIIALILLENLLNFKNNPMFGLYITSIGFFYGFAIGKTKFIISKMILIIIFLTSLIVMILLNTWFKMTEYNFILLCLTFFGFAPLIESFPIPNFCKFFGQFSEKYLLELYLLHAAFFIHPTTNRNLNFILSLFLIVTISMMLWYLSDFVRRLIFGTTTKTMRY